MSSVFYKLEPVDECPFCHNTDLEEKEKFRNSMRGNNYQVRTRTRVLFCSKCDKTTKEILDLED